MTKNEWRQLRQLIERYQMLNQDLRQAVENAQALAILNTRHVRAHEYQQDALAITHFYQAMLDETRALHEHATQRLAARVRPRSEPEQD